jgi:hypothetical protein
MMDDDGGWRRMEDDGVLTNILTLLETKSHALDPAPRQLHIEKYTSDQLFEQSCQYSPS